MRYFSTDGMTEQQRQKALNDIKFILIEMLKFIILISLLAFLVALIIE